MSNRSSSIANYVACQNEVYERARSVARLVRVADFTTRTTCSIEREPGLALIHLCDPRALIVEMVVTHRHRRFNHALLSMKQTRRTGTRMSKLALLWPHPVLCLCPSGYEVTLLRTRQIAKATRILTREMGFDQDEEHGAAPARSRRRTLGIIDDNISDSRPPMPHLSTTYPPTIPSSDDPKLFLRSPIHSVFSILVATTSADGCDTVSGIYGATPHLRRIHSAESFTSLSAKLFAPRAASSTQDKSIGSGCARS